MWKDFSDSVKVSPSLREVVDHETKLCYLLIFGIRPLVPAQRRTHRTTRQSWQRGLSPPGGGQGDHPLGWTRSQNCHASKQGVPSLTRCFPPEATGRRQTAEQAFPASLHLIRTVAKTLYTMHHEHGNLNWHIIQLCITAFF